MHQSDMMTLERHEEIVKLVNDRGRLTVSELSELFGVSETTIRRDLTTLSARHLLRRTHGGAMRIYPVATSEAPILQRQSEYADEKERIGAAAAKLIEDGETLLLIAGSTCLAFARYLNSRRNLTIITDSLLVAQELVRQGQHRVILLGGLINLDEYAVRGTLARHALSQFRVDHVVMGTRAVSVSNGVNAETLEEAEFQRICMACSQNVMLLADSSKFRLSALVQTAPLTDIDVLITDEGLDHDTVQEIQELGIYVVLA
jgi:DeoR family transcriptional regulator, fructose operon transcriptional repressor